MYLCFRKCCCTQKGSFTRLIIFVKTMGNGFNYARFKCDCSFLEFMLESKNCRRPMMEFVLPQFKFINKKCCFLFSLELNINFSLLQRDLLWWENKNSIKKFFLFIWRDLVISTHIHHQMSGPKANQRRQIILVRAEATLISPLWMWVFIKSS